MSSVERNSLAGIPPHSCFSAPDFVGADHFLLSDLLHRHIDRHRHQQQKIHAAGLQSPLHSPAAKSLSSPYAGNPRPMRSLSAESIPRSAIRDHPPQPLMHTNHYISNQHVQPLLPSPSNGPTGMSMQPCISPMQSMVPGMTLSQDYPSIPQQMFTHDVHHHSSTTNSPLNTGLVIPASPNNAAVFDMNAKWDHLFLGGGIFEMSSIFGIDSEFGNLTPPDLSVSIPLLVLLTLARNNNIKHISLSISYQRHTNSRSRRIHRFREVHGKNPSRITRNVSPTAILVLC